MKCQQCLHGSLPIRQCKINPFQQPDRTELLCSARIRPLEKKETVLEVLPNISPGGRDPGKLTVLCVTN